VACLCLKVSIAAGDQETMTDVPVTTVAPAAAASTSTASPVIEVQQTVNQAPVQTVTPAQSQYQQQYQPQYTPAKPRQDQNIAFQRQQGYNAEDAAAASVLGTRQQRYENGGPHYALTPMLGSSLYYGQWSNFVSNTLSFGMLLEIPIDRTFAFEAEGGYGRYRITYSGQAHHFDQYNLGGNLKAYLAQGPVRPYVGGGLMALGYTDMLGIDPNTMAPFITRYNKWVGAGQIVGGLDIAVTDSVSIGGRGAWIIALFNRPYTMDNGYVSNPAFGDAAAINTAYFKILGTVRVAF
jgi:hypothetical protein